MKADFKFPLTDLLWSRVDASCHRARKDVFFPIVRSANASALAPPFNIYGASGLRVRSANRHTFLADAYFGVLMLGNGKDTINKLCDPSRRQIRRSTRLEQHDTVEKAFTFS
jgi:hypothetical protein